MEFPGGKWYNQVSILHTSSQLARLELLWSDCKSYHQSLTDVDAADTILSRLLEPH